MSIAYVSDRVMTVLQASILERPLLELLRPEEQKLLQSCPAVLMSTEEPGEMTQMDTNLLGCTIPVWSEIS